MDKQFGIFWDLEFSRDIINVAKQLMSVSRPYNCCRAFDSVGLDFIDASVLGSLGWEVEKTQGDSGVHQAINSSILLWLWDVQRNFGRCDTCIVVVTSNPILVSVLKSAKDRGTFVVAIIDGANCNVDLWKSCSNFVVDGNDISELDFILESFNRPLSRCGSTKSNGSESMTTTASTTTTNSLSAEPLPPDFLGFSLGPSLGLTNEYSTWTMNKKSEFEISQNVNKDPKTLLQNRYVPTSIAPSQIFSYGEGDPISTVEEQKELIDKLAHGMNTGNVSFTVYILRTIYAKQCKNFRIPTILAYVSPDTSAYADAPFLLQCIAWCFGGLKGDNVESFKYKMNRNIARWIVKHIQKKVLYPPALPELLPLTISTIQEVLRQVAELDLAMELLCVVRAPDPLQILVHYVYMWSESTDPNIIKNVRTFCHKHCLPDIPFRGQRLPATLQMQQQGAGGATPSPPGFVGGMGGLTGGEGGFFPTDRVLQHQTAYSAELALVKNRLLALLQKAPHGILGARIPDIYLNEYGEQLNLQNLRLKDILLGSGTVEMVTVAGSGDRLFICSHNRRNKSH